MVLPGLCAVGKNYGRACTAGGQLAFLNLTARLGPAGPPPPVAAARPSQAELRASGGAARPGTARGAVYGDFEGDDVLSSWPIVVEVRPRLFSSFFILFSGSLDGW